MTRRDRRTEAQVVRQWQDKKEPPFRGAPPEPPPKDVFDSVPVFAAIFIAVLVLVILRLTGILH